MDIGHRNMEDSYQESADPSFEWDSAESDTESLAQERAYQQQLQRNINQSSPGEKAGFNNNVNASLKTDDDSTVEDEDMWVLDSLEMSNSKFVSKNSILSRGEGLVHQRHGSTNSQVFPDDAYSHLDHGASPKTQSNGTLWSQDSPLISVDTSFLVPEENPHKERKGGLKRDGYTLITSTSQPPTMTPENLRHDQPYLLHPQYGSKNTIATPPPPQSNSLLPSPCEERYTQPTAQNRASNMAEKNVAHNPNQTDAKKGQKVDKKEKPPKTLEDIVERNKLTLGRYTNMGSYAKAHAQRPLQNGMKAQHASKATSSSKKESNVQLRTSQQVSDMRKEKKGERKEDLNPAVRRQALTPGVNTEEGDSLGTVLTKAAVELLHKPPSSSQPVSPTIHLNISLNSASNLPLFKTHQPIIKLSCQRKKTHPTPNLQGALTSSTEQTGQNNHTGVYQESLHADLNLWNLENIPDQWQSVAAFKEQLLYPENEQDERLTKAQMAHSDQQISSTPSSSPQSCSSYKVLPPIGQPGPEMGPESTQRRVSDGYLVQMEKQKLLRTRPAYKAYSLKDYRQLKSDVTLQGLGPDFSAVEKTKMRRQKLYSNAVRRQNKTMSRIAGLPAKDAESSQKKVSRMKALEYAKTITKPLQSKTKEKREVDSTDDLTEHAPCVEGLDLSRMTTLELLRKRHEEEKLAVAMLRKIHMV